MIQGQGQKRLLATALAVLLTSSFAGASSLVLCLGSDGHRGLELAHPAAECPTFASDDAASDFAVSASISVSLQAPSECLDLPAAGTGPFRLAPADAQQVPAPPLALIPATPEPRAQAENRLRGAITAPNVPRELVRQLRATVLLV
jgi:hypothetical protein